METSILTATHKYAAAALFALALNQSQIHQTRPSNPLLPLNHEPMGETVSIGDSVSVSDQPQLWIHENSGLLLPVFRFLGVENEAWDGLKETAGSSSQVRHHVGAFLTLLSEETEKLSAERTDKELALTKTVDATVLCMESSSVFSEDASGSHEYEHQCRENYAAAETKPISGVAVEHYEITQKASPKLSTEEKDPNRCGTLASEKAMEEGNLLNYQRKVTVLYELLSACVGGNIVDDKKSSQQRKGYDARHRVALRLLVTWLGIKWIEMEAMEMMVACSLMASVTEEGAKEEDTNISESPWDKWKRGGIIGAAALTGGAMMAISGGLAAPAIGQGLGALAPTLGSLVPAIGASGFAAAAGATGSVAGSVTVAASFGAAGAGLTGSKMARRVGGIEEFEFKEIGENHNQGRLGVGILVSGIVFRDEDFIKPWEGHDDNLESYALRWESKNLIALSTAIQDWLTSKIVMELMKGGAMLTVLSTLLAALALPATLLTASDLIDGNWAIAVDRFDKAGKLLAEVLLKGLQGKSWTGGKGCSSWSTNFN